MGKNEVKNGMKRREFLKNSSRFVAGSVLLPIGSYPLLSAVTPSLKEKSVPEILLNNGISIPMLGFGTHTLKGAACEQYVSEAISVGFRLFDTATIYGNEEAVGAGIKRSGINRKELFVTSKLWVDDSGFDSTIKAFETSMGKLDLDYLDLYLIHRPRGDIKGTWKAMESLYETGKIKAIGVSNFEPDQLDELMTYAKIKPAINQIETHVFFQQPAAHQYLKQHDIQMEAWSPFAAGRNDIFNNQTLASIGKKYQKSNAQVCLRWHFQRGVIAIPRSSQKVHMIENLDIFDFELDQNDMETIAALDLNTTQFPEWG